MYRYNKILCCSAAGQHSHLETLRAVLTLWLLFSSQHGNTVSRGDKGKRKECNLSPHQISWPTQTVVKWSDLSHGHMVLGLINCSMYTKTTLPSDWMLHHVMISAYFWRLIRFYGRFSTRNSNGPLLFKRIVRRSTLITENSSTYFTWWECSMIKHVKDFVLWKKYLQRHRFEIFGLTPNSFCAQVFIP